MLSPVLHASAPGEFPAMSGATGAAPSYADAVAAVAMVDCTVGAWLRLDASWRTLLAGWWTLPATALASRSYPLRLMLPASPLADGTLRFCRSRAVVDGSGVRTVRGSLLPSNHSGLLLVGASPFRPPLTVSFSKAVRDGGDPRGDMPKDGAHTVGTDNGDTISGSTRSCRGGIIGCVCGSCCICACATAAVERFGDSGGRATIAPPCDLGLFLGLVARLWLPSTTALSCFFSARAFTSLSNEVHDTSLGLFPIPKFLGTNRLDDAAGVAAPPPGFLAAAFSLSLASWSCSNVDVDLSLPSSSSISSATDPMTPLLSLLSLDLVLGVRPILVARNLSAAASFSYVLTLCSDSLLIALLTVFTNVPSMATAVAAALPVRSRSPSIPIAASARCRWSISKVVSDWIVSRVMSSSSSPVCLLLMSELVVMFIGGGASSLCLSNRASRSNVVSEWTVASAVRSSTSIAPSSVVKTCVGY
mmetsp:Transcript_36795/g.78441  ORF Transcript_36795/g.78441 Transcript_36795/m.78441 type:complete len:475 (-) Transcript_36795:1466-2890(-)